MTHERVWRCRRRRGQARTHELCALPLLLWTLLVLASAHGAPRSARAELPPGEPQRTAGEPQRTAAEPPLLVRLAPTARQLHHEHTRMLEQRLVRLVSGLPGVERAEVVLDLPLVSEQPLDRPPPAPRVTAVITTRSARQIRPSIERVVSAVLPELALSDLSVIETPSERAPAPDAGAKGALSLVQIGPFRVHRESASALRHGLALLLGTNALLAAILLWRTRLTRSRTDRQTES